MIKVSIQTNTQRQEILSFLEQDPACNLYQLDLFDATHAPKLLEWTAVYESNRVIAVCVSSNRPFPGFSSGLSVPYGRADACLLLGAWEQEKGGTRHVLGERSATDAFYEGLGSPPALVHCAERLFYSDQIPEEGTYLPLSTAKEEQLEYLLPLAAQMQEEDLGFHPMERYGDRFRSVTLARIQEQKFLVGMVQNEVGYLIDVGTLSSRGAQVGSMIVPNHLRGQGLGALGMRGCLAFLLEQAAFVTLIARESNIPAIKTHHKAGYVEKNPFRMIVLQ